MSKKDIGRSLNHVRIKNNMKELKKEKKREYGKNQKRGKTINKKGNRREKNLRGDRNWS